MAQPQRLSPLRLAVLISGGGTTLRNFIERIEAGQLDASIVRVVSSSGKARGLQYAADAGIPASVVRRSDFADDASFGAAVFDVCRRDEPHLVAMAGFLKFAPVPDDFLGRVMNIHPALIPSFCGAGYYGHHVHEAVLAYGAKVSGCTVHFVDNQYDHGPVILQRTVPVLDDDTPELLAQRVFAEECEAYPEALRLFAEGRLTIDGRRVRITAE
ncbi:MAG: phosphoribosylglycinamide formyltransferase [Pirellulales bacterium]